VNPGDEQWLVDAFVSVVIAAAALRRCVHRRASPAAVEILDARSQFTLERVKSLKLLTRLLEPRHKHLAKARHPERRNTGILDDAAQFLELVQRETRVLQLANPRHALDSRRRIQPKTTLGPMHGLEQTQLFVQMERTDRFSGPLGKLANAQCFSEL
jgi:hypothetical protein